MPIRRADDAHRASPQHPRGRRRRWLQSLSLERRIVLVCGTAVLTALIGAVEGLLEFIFYTHVGHPLVILFRLKRGLGWGATMGAALAILPCRAIWIGLGLAALQVAQCAPGYWQIKGVTPASILLYAAWAAALVAASLAGGRLRAFLATTSPTIAQRPDS